MKRQSGVYEIRNLINGKRYIGSSKDIRKRWNRHKNELYKNKHHSIYLQRAWNLHGCKNFTFNILEIVEFDIQSCEYKWIEKENPEYNVGNVGGGDNISKNPNLEAIKQKHSNNLKARWNKEEFRTQQIIRLSGETNPNWKGGVSKPKCKKCGKELRHGHEHCSKCSKIGALNPFAGKSHSVETKNKVREKMLGKKPVNRKKIMADGILYQSATDAAKALSVSVGTVTFRVKSKYWDYYYIATEPESAGPL